MMSRFTNIILIMRELGFSSDDITEVISLEVQCANELDWVSENVKGSNAREDEVVRIIDYYNELEDEIFGKYI